MPCNYTFSHVSDISSLYLSLTPLVLLGSFGLFFYRRAQSTAKSIDHDNEEYCEEQQPLLDDESLCDDLQSRVYPAIQTAPFLVFFPALNSIISVSLVIGELVVAEYRNDFRILEALTWVYPTDLITETINR